MQQFTKAQIAQLVSDLIGTTINTVANKSAGQARFEREFYERVQAADADAALGKILTATDFDAAREAIRLALTPPAPKRSTDAQAAEAFAKDGTVLDGYETSEGALVRHVQSDDGPTVKVIYDPQLAKTAEEKPKPKRPLGKRAAILAAAEAGTLPEKPDFSAATHTRFRGKLDEVHGFAQAGDLESLEALSINATSTSPKAIMRYRDLCIIAIKAQRAQAKAA